LRAIAKSFGKQVDFVCDSDKPSHYAFLPEYDEFNVKKFDKYDLVISVDCADESRLGRYYSYFKKAKVAVNIDHHITNPQFGAVAHVEPTASSTCELIYDLISDDYKIDKEVATYLYLGISTDTGHFRHNNTTTHTFEVASKLLKAGADVEFIINGVYRNNTKNKLDLIATAIKSFRFFDDDKIVVITITRDDLAKCGCALSDTEGIIDYGMSISKVQVAVCMSEQNIRSYKVSFRSKGADVAKSAMVFGGGGHKLASGCVVNGYYDDVVDKVVKAVRDEMN
jgi:phosphoesterase RecJ-like protein